MAAYVLRRVAQIVPVLALVMAAVFTIFRLLPGDAAEMILGAEPDPAALAALRHQFGLDEPLPIQFLRWVGQALHGDLGVSRINDQPVMALVLQKAPATLELAVLGLLIGSLVGIPLGVVSALTRGSWTDLAVRIVSFFGFSLPNYWLAVLLVIVLSLGLGWLPPAGYAAPQEDLLLNLRYAILPALTVGLPVAAEQTRFLRASMLDVLHQDYVRTAHAKGLPQRPIVTRHIFKNALIPLLTIVGLEFGFLLGGSVVIEQIFTWPGIGLLTFQSIQARDYPVVQGAVFLTAVGFVAVNLLVDISYVVLDPRLRSRAR